MTRLACLRVPLFPLAARLRAEPELAGAAVVVCEGNGSAARVVAASRPARMRGVRAGMTLAHARGIVPDLIARGCDTDAESSAHEALLEVVATVSPRTEDAKADLVYADIDGMHGVFPGPDGERDLGQAAIVAAERLRLPVRVGIASTKLAARQAASRPDTPVVVPDGEEAAFLAPLPVASLGLSSRLLDTLRRWGVTTVGDLARLPTDRIVARLGAAGGAAHRAARGEDPRPLVPTAPPASLTEGLQLEWAVVTLEPLLAAVRGALERLEIRLAQHDLACTRLELELELEPDGVDRRTLRLPAPTRDPDALVGLVRHELEARSPQAPVVGFRCLAWPDRPRRGQLTLFGAPEIPADELAATLARLVALLGAQAVGSPRMLDDHRPEAVGSAPFDPPPPPKLRRPPSDRGRGLLAVRVLRPPVPLEVITDGEPGAIPGDGVRLVSVASASGAEPRIQGLVRVAAGPWRLEEGWWKEEPTARDYWDVELSGGDLYRIYRRRSDGEWFADGMYD